MKTKYQVTTIGDCLKDIFVFAPAKLLSSGSMMGKKKKYLSFGYGEKVRIDKINYDLGGSSCNAAAALSKLGIKTSFATMMGDDIYSREALEILKSKKVGTTSIKKEKGNSLGFSIILTGPTGDRSILTKRFDYDFNKIDMGKIYKDTDFVYVSGINKNSKVLQKKIITYTKKTGKPLYLNPSSFQLSKNLTILKKMIKNSEVTCLNLAEALIFLRKRRMKIRELMKKIKRIGAGVVLVTAGPKGAFCYDGNNFYRVGIYDNKKVDSTGSGDAFFATFVASRIKGKTIEDSLKLASINAGSIVSVFGAQKGLLDWRKLLEKFDEDKVAIRKI